VIVNKICCPARYTITVSSAAGIGQYAEKSVFCQMEINIGTDNKRYYSGKIK
jgi:hypothetical protein